MLLEDFAQLRTEASLDSVGDSFMEDQSISLDEIEDQFGWVRDIKEYVEAAKWLDEVYGDSLDEDIYVIPNRVSVFHCHFFVSFLRNEMMEGSVQSDTFHFTRHTLVVFSSHSDYPGITTDHLDDALDDLDMELDERIKHHMI